jgi:AcrR family transcriptional regulator
MKPAARAETRGERRKRQTETRLLDAALAVFCARGYDAATTGEIARAADVGAGTFYLYFKDKRATYERLARRAAHDLLASWQVAMRPEMSLASRVDLGLRLAADYWRADPARARLLLEGGPSFGSENHLRFVDEIAATLAAGASRRGRAAPFRALALLLAGLGIELGRLIVAHPDPDRDVEELVRLMRRSLGHLDLSARPGGRRAQRA